MAQDPRLSGRPRRTCKQAVRARTDHPTCPLCHYPIDRTLQRTGQRHPLSSVVDEWLPRSKGGNPHNPDHCAEMHATCNRIKSNTWPIPTTLYDTCRQHVEQLLGHHDGPTLQRTW